MTEADYNETLKAANEITDKHKRMLRNLEDDPEMKINYPERLRKFNKAGQLQYEWFEDVADCIEDLEDTLCFERSVSGELTYLIEKLKAKLSKAREEGFWVGHSCGGTKEEIDAALEKLKGQDDE